MAAVVLAVSATPMSAAPARSVTAAPAGRPNIVLILTDDQEVESVNHTPRVQSLLVDQGTVFSNFFVNISLCCPSRASILRGQYPHNHQIKTNQYPGGGFRKFEELGLENSTVATWLQAVGYRTVLLGKYLNGYPRGDNRAYVPPGWDEWYSPGDGAYSGYNYQMNENGRVVPYGERPEDYLTDVLAGYATSFIRRAANGERPFFMYLATYAPHEPQIPAPRHLDAFPDVKAPRPPSFNEADTSDKPEFVRNESELSQSDINRIDRFYRERLQSLLAVDEMVENLVETLRETGQLDNTYILYTSDNGYHMGQHRLNPRKQTAYEEDIRVPMIVRGPGVPAGRIAHHLGLNSDLAPTFAELADAAIPDLVDGRSLVPLLHGGPGPSDWRRAFLVEHWPAGSYRIHQYEAVRTDEYKYVEYENGDRELYDLRADPYELESLHATADPSLLSRLATLLEQLRRCAGPTCRAVEDAGP
jgi:arylsulfatase A-like enzyme